MRSSSNLSDIVSGIIKDLIDQEYSSIQAPIVHKSVIEKPANNPCKSFPVLLVKIQFGRLKPKLSNQIPLACTQKLILVLLRSGGNKTKAKVPVVPQPV